MTYVILLILTYWVLWLTWALHKRGEQIDDMEAELRVLRGFYEKGKCQYCNHAPCICTHLE
jgi:hypothetical protein